MNTFSIKTAIGDSHSKLILVGEHAVVYGKPAIAIPFPLKTKSIIRKAVGNIILESSIYDGPIDKAPLKMKGISDTIKETLYYLNQPFKNLHIRIDSTIPLGRGLGSSAAVAIAIVRSLFSFYGQKLSDELLFYFVQIAETYAHGNPSGIDMTVESSKSPIWFQKGRDSVALEIGRPLYIVVADTGRIGNTHKAVGNVRKRYLFEQAKVQKSLDKIGEIANSAKEALQQGDMYLLGKLLNHNQRELAALGVSDDGLNRLIKSAKDNGALGAKLTGGGLGGCMIALASSLEQAKTISDELIKCGAAKSWYFSTECDDLYASKAKGMSDI